MSVRKVLLVFDLPNLVHVWAEVCNVRPPSRDINWQKLKIFLREHARYNHGQEVETEFRVFANRSGYSVRRKLINQIIKQLRTHGYHVVVKFKDTPSSDIDDDLRLYVEKTCLEDPNLCAVYLIGNDLRNHMPIAKKLSDACYTVWLGVLPSSFDKSTTFYNNPSDVFIVDLETIPEAFCLPIVTKDRMNKPVQKFTYRVYKHRNHKRRTPRRRQHR